MRNNNISQEDEAGVSAELCLTVLAEMGISLDEDDRIELSTSLISIRGMSEGHVNDRRPFVCSSAYDFPRSDRNIFCGSPVA